jgi:hypothetical protein
MKLKLLFTLLLLASVVQATTTPAYPTCTSSTDIGQLQCWFSSFGIDIIGGGILLGTVIVILFAIWLTVGGYSFETTIMALWVLGFLLSATALVPSWFQIVMIILGVIPMFLAGVKIAGNIGL